MKELTLVEPEELHSVESTVEIVAVESTPAQPKEVFNNESELVTGKIMNPTTDSEPYPVSISTPVDATSPIQESIKPSISLSHYYSACTSEIEGFEYQQTMNEDVSLYCSAHANSASLYVTPHNSLSVEAY